LYSCGVWSQCRAAWGVVSSSSERGTGRRVNVAVARPQCATGVPQPVWCPWCASACALLLPSAPTHPPHT
jgi:hypothetical protein